MTNASTGGLKNKKAGSKPCATRYVRIKSLSEHSFQYLMRRKIRAMLTHGDICKAVDEVAPKYNIKSAYYFGSYARGTPTGDSDLDILAEFSKPISLFMFADFIALLEDRLGIPVDVISLPLDKDTHLIIDKVVKCYGEKGLADRLEDMRRSAVG
jgi:predicted nucleotidyltransferase